MGLENGDEMTVQHLRNLYSEVSAKSSMHIPASGNIFHTVTMVRVEHDCLILESIPFEEQMPMRTLLEASQGMPDEALICYYDADARSFVAISYCEYDGDARKIYLS